MAPKPNSNKWSDIQLAIAAISMTSVIAFWNMFAGPDKVKADQKAAESKAKLAANKEASADILAPIKEAKRIVEFGKWLNTAGNPFRKQHFNKKYTIEAVNAFLSI